MSSFAELNIFNQIIKLPEVKVKDYQFIDGFGLVLTLEKIDKKSACPRCGKKSERLHQNHEYLVRDLPHAEQDVFLRVNRRQLKCDRCKKPFSEEFDFIEKTRTYTKRLAQKIITEVVESDIKNVAERNGLSEREVETILKEQFSDLKLDKPIGLKKLGIDEIAWVKGHKNYCAVLVDLETRKPIDILEKRTQDGLKEKLRSIFNSNKSEVVSLLKLTHWLKKAATYFPDSCGTIIRWFAEIIPYFKNRTTQGAVEGINNKLKLIKRKGFGFRNFDNFRLRSLLSFHF